MIIILVVKRMKDFYSSGCEQTLSQNIFANFYISPLFFSYKIGKINSWWDFLFCLILNFFLFFFFRWFFLYLRFFSLVRGLFKFSEEFIFLFRSFVVNFAYFNKGLYIDFTWYHLWYFYSNDLLLLSLNMSWHLYLLVKLIVFKNNAEI